MNIVFNAAFPRLLRERVDTILTAIQWIMPPWLQSLHVAYDPTNTENSCYIHENKTYRFAHLSICGHWANETDQVQVETLIHELLHLHTSPVKNYAVEVLGQLTKDDVLHDIVEKELIRKNESSTQDLAFVIYNKLYKDSKEIEL